MSRTVGTPQSAFDIIAAQVKTKQAQIAKLTGEVAELQSALLVLKPPAPPELPLETASSRSSHKK